MRKLVVAMPPKSKTKKKQKNQPKRMAKKAKPAQAGGEFKRTNVEYPVSQAFITSGQVPRVVGAVTHKDEGSGIRIVGTEEIGVFRQGALDLYGIVLYNTSGPNWLVNPSNVPTTSRLYALAYPWTKFRFNRVVVRNSPQIPSNNGAGINFAIGFVKDPVQAWTSPTSTTHRSIMECPPAASFPAWYPGSISVNRKDLGENTYFIDVNSGLVTDSDYRQSYQGVVNSCCNVEGSADFVTGLAYLDYDVELYGPRNFADLAAVPIERTLTPRIPLAVRLKVAQDEIEKRKGKEDFAMVEHKQIAKVPPKGK